MSVEDLGPVVASKLLSSLVTWDVAALRIRTALGRLLAPDQARTPVERPNSWTSPNDSTFNQTIQPKALRLPQLDKRRPPPPLTSCLHKALPVAKR